MVYGALPPEMRRTQARLFNDPDSGYDVLVASDAVGMGLNLNIRRIIFHALSKVENGVRVPISTSQIKQIAGEAAVPLLYDDCVALGYESASWGFLIIPLTARFRQSTACMSLHRLARSLC